MVLLREATEDEVVDEPDSEVGRRRGGIASVVALFRGDAGTVEVIEVDVIELEGDDTAEADDESSEGEPKASVDDLFGACVPPAPTPPAGAQRSRRPLPTSPSPSPLNPNPNPSPKQDRTCC